jgi:hypothetical protein
MAQAPARPDGATPAGPGPGAGGERGKQPLDAGQGGGAAGVEDLEASMAEIGAWHDKHSSSGKLADSRHQLDWPDKAKTARASEVTSSRAVVVTGGGPIVRWVEGQRTAS